jgi:DNA/RNA endonuclease G (NUC1)
MKQQITNRIKTTLAITALLTTTNIFAFGNPLNGLMEKGFDYTVNAAKEKYNSYKNNEKQNTSNSGSVDFSKLENNKITLKNTNCDKTLTRLTYVACFDNKTNGSLYVSSDLRSELVNNHRNRDDNKFEQDMDVAKQNRINQKEYTNSGFDRGHLQTNSHSDATEESQQETFLMSNILPQTPELNRGAMKELEIYISQLTKKEGRLLVITGPVYKDGYDNRLSTSDRVVVASHFFKIYNIPSKNITNYYVIPNDNMVDSRNYRKYQITKEQAKAKYGIEIEIK